MRPHEEHRREAPENIACAVITVSDTRDERSDRGGPVIVKALEEAGLRVLSRDIVPDEAPDIEACILRHLEEEDCDAVILTGGTGVSTRDGTVEVVERICERTLPGFGELFRALSYQEIGSACILSRALAGVRGRQALFALPGSPGALHTAMSKIILPELGHLLREIRK